MLLELRLENYAVIDNIRVEFAPGLNLLTGETGAGKSILVDALALLLGDKASTDIIRSGRDRALISAVFELEGGAAHRVAHILDENGLNAEGEPVILRREISSLGKGRVFVNNQPASVAVLKELGPHLATVHAQNQSLVSFDAAARLSLLDSFAGLNCDAISSALEEWKLIRRRILELASDERDRLHLVDLWSYQKREIEEAKCQPGEDERLEAERRLLANAEKIYNAAMNAFDLLYEGTGSSSATLRAAQKHVEELVRYEPRFKEALAALDTARISVEDVGETLRDYAGGVEASPEHLAQVEDRLALIDRLKRKYGPTLGDVIHFGAEIAGKLSQMENKDEALRQLRRDLAGAGEKYLQAARSISHTRHELRRRLEKLVEAQINDLAMKAVFRVDIASAEDEEQWTSTGFDQVTYLFSPNPGEPLRPLEEIASGGELSRIMLALKVSVESGETPTRKKENSGAQRTLVFDEIDTGIGGAAAEAVGKKLKALSLTNQVLCITHWPQIAIFADHHYLIEKKVSSGTTRTTVRPIRGEERTQEIARMLSGAKLTETSRKHAEHMLKSNA